MMMPAPTPTQATDIISYMTANNANVYLLLLLVSLFFIAIAVIMLYALYSNKKLTDTLMSKNTSANTETNASTSNNEPSYINRRTSADTSLDKLPSLVRTSLAFSILLLVGGIIFYLLLSGKYDTINTALSSIISIFGTVIGFYFGNKKKNCE